MRILDNATHISYLKVINFLEYIKVALAVSVLDYTISSLPEK